MAYIGCLLLLYVEIHNILHNTYTEDIIPEMIKVCSWIDKKCGVSNCILIMKSNAIYFVKVNNIFRKRNTKEPCIQCQKKEIKRKLLSLGLRRSWICLEVLRGIFVTWNQVKHISYYRHSNPTVSSADNTTSNNNNTGLALYMTWDKVNYIHPYFSVTFLGGLAQITIKWVVLKSSLW